MRRTLLVMAIVAVIVPAAFGAARAEPLTVCLEKNSPPLSWAHDGKQGGFDLLVASAVGKRLGRAVTVRWFGLSEQLESDKTPDVALEAALLADGQCQLIGGYALLAGMLGMPSPSHARLPSVDGMSRADRARDIVLRPLAATHGYHFLGLTVLLAPRSTPRPIHALGDLAGMSIGVEGGTLGDAVAQNFRRGAFAAQVREFAPGLPLDRGGGVLDRLERGDFDAAVIETNAFDAYRAVHPATKIQATGYIHPVGFNIGFAGLASDATLLRQVDDALVNLMARGELSALAAKAGVTFLPPRPPEVRRITLVDLEREQ